MKAGRKTFGISRRTAVVLSSLLGLIIGIFIEAEPNVGAWMDFVSIIIVPFGAVLGAISIYYILGWSDIRQELEKGHGPRLSCLVMLLALYMCL